jgi:hypothetical protein
MNDRYISHLFIDTRFYMPPYAIITPSHEVNGRSPFHFYDRSTCHIVPPPSLHPFFPRRISLRAPHVFAPGIACPQRTS